MKFPRRLYIATMVSLMATTVACSDPVVSRVQDRALSGTAIGAAGGAGFGLLTGGNPVAGALLGGAAGVVIAALTTEHPAHAR